jgi:hypothetical protein
MKQEQCEVCTGFAPGYDMVRYGSMENGYRLLCTRCLNDEVAKVSGLTDFENVRLSPIGMLDCDGRSHEFHFRTRLLGNMIVLDAFELQEDVPAGYQCRVIGNPDDDVLTMLGRLVEKMRRMLAIRHITDDGPFGPQIVDQTVRGRIESTQTSVEPTPCIVVDGREISWGDFGRMLMSFEGWQFKLEIADSSDEP